MTWRAEADSVIDATAAAFVAETGADLAALTVEQRVELARRIREAYPFGPRSMWPYKVWLSACRRFWDLVDGKRATRPRGGRDLADENRRRRADLEAAGQRTLEV